MVDQQRQVQVCLALLMTFQNAVTENTQVHIAYPSFAQYLPFGMLQADKFSIHYLTLSKLHH
jgi:hypothetical protein